MGLVGLLRAARFVAALAVTLSVAACTGAGSGEACVTDAPGLAGSCAPLYTPTFDQIYTRTLVTTCAQPGSVCHSTAGVQGGLFFASEDSAYRLLLGEDGAPSRVTPGDPGCSTLIERLDASDPTQLMPPGAKLPDAELCAIVQWIQQGAKR
jgi:hypothetical protein